MPQIQLAVFVLSSFIGVVIGAVLQYSLGRRAEKERHVQARQADAYVELIKALAALFRRAGTTDEQEHQLAVLYTEARTKVAIYGSTRVVTAFAAFLRLVETQSPEAMGQLPKMVQAMRLDGLGKGRALDDADLAQVLFSAAIDRREFARNLEARS